MPCWKTEFLRVLQMIRSAHCTTTMLTKKAVWHVNSTTFLCSYVCKSHGQVQGGVRVGRGPAPRSWSAPRAKQGLCPRGVPRDLRNASPLRLLAPWEESGTSWEAEVKGDRSRQAGNRDPPRHGGRWEGIEASMGLLRG